MEAGLPVAKTVPKEGNWGIRTGMQIPRHTANLQGAVAWTNTLLGVPSQTAFARSLYAPTNGRCSFPPEQQARLILGADRINAIREAALEGDPAPARRHPGPLDPRVRQLTAATTARSRPARPAAAAPPAP